MTNGFYTCRSIGEIADNFDADRRPVKASDRRPGLYPYYGAQGVVDHVDGYLFDGQFVLVAEDGENLRSRNEPIALLADGKFWVNNHAHILRGNANADTRFLFYAINAMDISGYVTGSTIPKLSQGNLNRLLVPCPTIAEQRAIAATLGALDDKIDLNRRMNETLEAMARAIFKDWFVDFGPTRAKMEGREPYLGPDVWALFPGRLDDDGKPEGWTKVKLGEVTIRITKGTTPTAEEMGAAPKSDQKINFIKVNALTDGGQILTGKLEPIPRHVHAGVLRRSILQSEDILYSIAGTIGRVAFVEDELLPANTNQALAIIRANPARVPARFLLLLLRQREFVDSLHVNIVHAVQANLSLSMISDAQFVLPSENLFAGGFPKLEAIIKKQEDNNRETRSLAAMRDLLLPKLMSGEIRIRDAQKAVEAVL